MKAYILTLMGRPDRVASAKELQAGLQAAGFDCELFAGIDKGQQNWKQRVRPFSLARGLTAGQICCSEGHMRLCQKVLDAGEPCLICEDDVVLIDGMGDQLRGFVRRRLPKQFHWIQLFKGTWNKPAWHAVAESRHWWEVDWGHWGRVAYILSPEGAADLLPRNNPIQWVGDVFFKYVWGDGNMSRRAFISKPTFFEHRGITSRIGPRGKHLAGQA